MIRTVTLWLMLGASAAPLIAQTPQQEWRPSVAEDNKTATLSDTTAFMVGALNSPAASSNSGQLIWNAEAVPGCGLHFRQVYAISQGTMSLNLRLFLSRVVTLPPRNVSLSELF